MRHHCSVLLIRPYPDFYLPPDWRCFSDAPQKKRNAVQTSQIAAKRPSSFGSERTIVQKSFIIEMIGFSKKARKKSAERPRSSTGL
jgi:hypothetical protein